MKSGKVKQELKLPPYWNANAVPNYMLENFKIPYLQFINNRPDNYTIVLVMT